MKYKEEFYDSGSISVFLALVLVVIMSLLCTITESARLYSAKYISGQISGAAVDSTFACYAKEMFSDYGVLFLWKNEDEFIATLKESVNRNIDMGKSTCNLYQLELDNIELIEADYATDDAGDVFFEQVMEYMKYQSVKDIAEGIINKLVSYTEIDVDKYVEVISEQKENLEIILKRVDSSVSKVKTTIEKIEEQTEKVISYAKENEDNISQIITKAEKLKESIKEQKMIIEELCEEIEGYEDCKEEAQESLKEWNIVADEKQDEVSTSGIVLKDIIEKLDNLENTSFEEENKEEVIKWVEEYEAVLDDLKNTELFKEEDETENMTQSSGNIIDSIQNLLNSGILSLVLENGENVSENSVESKNSVTVNGKSKSETTMLDNAMYGLYIKDVFGNYRNEKKDTTLKYEMEYILCGKKNDRENLAGACEKILAFREGLNATHIFMSAEKRQEAYNLAVLITAASGAIVLTYIVQALIIAAWALAESVVDVRNLMKGKKVPLIKTDDNWNLSIEGLEGFLSGNAEFNDNAEGIDYDTYMLMLIMFMNNGEKIKRTMELIQFNMQDRYNDDFRLEDCLASAKVKIRYKGKEIFTGLSFVGESLTDGSNHYLFNTEVSYGY